MSTHRGRMTLVLELGADYSQRRSAAGRCSRMARLKLAKGVAMPKVANVLFPADYFEKGAPDGSMRVEYESACAEKRLDVRLFDLELFEERGQLSLDHPFLDEALPLVYRGWMMKPERYEAFFAVLREKGLCPMTLPGAYEEFHMFPLAYMRNDALKVHAPRLVAFPGHRADARVIIAHSRSLWSRTM